MDDATLSFSRTGAKLGAILVNGTYIWNTQTAKLLKVLAMTSVGVDFATFSPDLDYIACSDLKDRDQVLVFCMAPKPYDKHPEWETLKGHSDPVKACCIANRESGHPLIATASDDSTVQLWDTRNMPSQKVVKLPNHVGTVQYCTFSSNGRLAVSCSETENWVWQACEPVQRLHQLRPASDGSGIGPCFSEDDQFVSVFTKTGVDVWHLKSGVDCHGSDASLIMGAHRTLTFLTVRHLFTKFTSDGLYCCLATDSEPSTIRLYLAVNKYTLDEWAKNEPRDPPPKDLGGEREPFEQRFSVDKGQKVTEAVISNTCGKLAAIGIPQSSSNQEVMKGPTEVHLWDLNYHTNWRVVLSEHPSVSRQLTVGCNHLITFIQIRKHVSVTERLKSGLLGFKEDKAFSMADEAVIQIFDMRGSALQTFRIPGRFSGFNGASIDSSLKSLSEELVAYGFDDGVFKAKGVKSNKVPRTFTVHNTKITAVNMASNGRSALVGCANGNVHVIQII